MLRTQLAVTITTATLSLGLALAGCSKDHGSGAEEPSGSPASSKPTTADPNSPPPRSGAIPQLRTKAPATTAPTASDLPAEANPPSAPTITGQLDSLDGVRYVDVKVGDGAAPVAGEQVRVHYTGWLTDGKKFDSSRDRGEPIAFKFDTGQVIKGWDIGLSTMKVGGKRRLIIPPELGYGDRGAGNAIPPGATLVFDVELMGVGD